MISVNSFRCLIFFAIIVVRLMILKFRFDLPHASSCKKISKHPEQVIRGALLKQMVLRNLFDKMCSYNITRTFAWNFSSQIFQKYLSTIS